MVRHYSLLIASAVVTFCLLVAWIVTTCVGAAHRNRNAVSRTERDSIIRSISGEKGVKRAHLGDAVEQGYISKQDASTLEKAL